MSIRVTRWPRLSSASATPLPLVSDTSRSADQPPISTDDMQPIHDSLPPAGSPIRDRRRLLAHAPAHFLAERLDVGGRRLAEVEQEVAMLLGDLAPPTVRPRQPAASISFQALVPGGFLKVEPPVRLRSGWLASRSRRCGPSRPGSRRLVGMAAKGGADDDAALRQLAVAIGVAEIGEQASLAPRRCAGPARNRPGRP